MYQPCDTTASIESAENATLRDSIYLRNKCSDSQCDNAATLTGKISESVGNELRQTISSENICRVSECGNSVNTAGEIIDSSEGAINTEIGQSNKCEVGSNCENIVESKYIRCLTAIKVW